ncbi:outer membrane beta-barrel protein [Salinimicrobium sediminilitoris]|uniref:outer membrane beta-barrel protein n=1 Tax=Salinimicrobium sediminilitoris TaxID=2876715 RepID=UPI001E40E60C|nr:outer membrane beta-barrel protein [Salinimicrobium sediminilitoris]MCC8359028.1 TonB-dependent receptor [Salinimicrobium sediminilitoris]
MIASISRHRCSALFFSFFFLLSFSAFAQGAQYEVSGKVTDEQGTPLEYATISFQSTNDPDKLTGGITDAQGNFAIEVPEGNYVITAEFIGFSPKKFPARQINSDIEMGRIVLGMAAGELEEVVVTAETTQVEVRLDKKIYNIGKDLTTAGGTVADALNNVPSVAVDIEGGISLRGNENVRILINGKPSAMAGFGNTDVLSQLPADAIERVEVITSPSARYDAEGTAGILNIILKKEKTLGFNGSVTAQVGHPDQVGLSANVNYRTDKFNFFNTTGFRYFDAPGNAFSDTYYFARNEADPYRLIEDRDMQRLNRNFNTNFGVEYYITDMSSITATAFLRYGEDEDLTTNMSRRFDTSDPENRGILVRRTERVEAEMEEDNSYQFSINYINKFNNSGHQLTADLQYENDAETQTSVVNEKLLLNELPDEPDFFDEEAVTEETQEEYLIQADYVLPIGEESQFEAGFRGNFEEELTEYVLELEDPMTGNFVINDTLSNDFTYNENVLSLYSQYGTKIGDFSFLLGLRLENTQLKGKIESELTEAELQDAYGIPIDTDFDNNYLGLFPTVNIIYEIDERENITIGYNRRINRPRGWYMNPFPSRSSRINIFQGNPNLEPAFSNAFDVGYLKRWDEKLTLTSSVYYQRETNSFQRIEESTGEFTEEDGILIIRTIPVNFATNTRIGAEAGALYNPTDWLRLNGSINFFQFDTEGEYRGDFYSAKNTSWFARFSSKLTLPAEIQWQTNAFYRGASEDIQGTQDGLLSIDMAVAKEFFNETLSLSLNVRDLLNSRKRESISTTDFYTRDSRFQWRQRSVTLSLTYRFNQQKRDQRRNERDSGNGEDNGGEGEF